jgi:hypothetical protein
MLINNAKINFKIVQSILFFIKNLKIVEIVIIEKIK